MSNDRVAVWAAADDAAVAKGLASSSARRFIVVVIPHMVVDGFRVPSGAPAYIFKRSDSLDVARGHARRKGSPSVIVDRDAGARVR